MENDETMIPDKDVSVFKTPKGINEDIVREISAIKGEPEWMLEYRLKALDCFLKKPMPTWGVDLSRVDFDEYTYYIRPSDKQTNKWEEVPETIKDTFDKLGIPEAEQKYLSGVTTQYESEVVYHNMLKEVQEKGVIFLDIDSGLREYPELFKKYFDTVIPYNDNKFSALNGAVWSGGSFIYVPPGVKLEKPLQSYFRINSEQMGQFERTLIIVDKGSDIHYVEGCTAPIFSKDSLFELLKSILKISLIIYVAYTSIKGEANDIFILYDIPLNQAVVLCGNVIINAGFKISLVYLVVGIADFVYQKHRFNEDMKMTKQEVKDEYKNTEGNPEIKGRQRQRMREASQRRMMQDVPKADVVITNPTHLAVAIKYDAEVSRAPIVIAKGEDYLAQKIREKAKENHIEIVENKPLARMLYANVDIGAEIPPELYQAVAEILAMVYNLRNREERS